MKSSTKRANELAAQESRADALEGHKFSSTRLQWRIYLVLLVCTDILLLYLAFDLAYSVRFYSSWSIFQLNAFSSPVYYDQLNLLMVIVWMACFALCGLYSRKNLLGGTDEYSLLFRATFSGFILLLFASFIQPAFIFARGWMLLSWFLSYMFTGIGRFFLRRIIYSFRSSGFLMSPTVIIGANDEGLSLARQLIGWQTSGLKVVGFLDKKIKPGTQLIGNLRVLGTVDEVEQIVEKYKIEELILARSAISTHEKLLDIFKLYGFSNKINLRMSSGLYEILTTGLTIKEFAYVPLVCVNKVRLTGNELFLKTAVDMALSFILTVVLSPLLLLIALIVKFDSPGPVIHRRRVMGVNLSQFDAYKFRTMYINGDEILAQRPELVKELAETHKLKDDPRITRSGKFLRKFSLDELPQLINVLTRRMSLVGPRMISPEELKNYNHWGLNLLTIRPGITGLWQVSGRSNLTYEERVRLDMHYIRNWSIWLDLQLLMRTIPVALKGRGAY